MSDSEELIEEELGAIRPTTGGVAFDGGHVLGVRMVNAGDSGHIPSGQSGDQVRSLASRTARRTRTQQRPMEVHCVHHERMMAQILDREPGRGRLSLQDWNRLC